MLGAPAVKRLAPMMAELMPRLRRFEELIISDEIAAALIAMSAATMDRRLVAQRAKMTLLAMIMPFPITGVDSDNGSEFINHHLLDWCERHKIAFTRSRPGNSNDGALRSTPARRSHQQTHPHEPLTRADRSMSQRLQLCAHLAVSQQAPAAARYKRRRRSSSHATRSPSPY